MCSILLFSSGTVCLTLVGTALLKHLVEHLVHSAQRLYRPCRATRSCVQSGALAFSAQSRTSLSAFPLSLCWQNAQTDTDGTERGETAMVGRAGKPPSLCQSGKR